MSKHPNTPRQVIYACGSGKCQKHGGKEIRKTMRDQLKMAGLKDEVEIIKTDCTDRCKHGPIFSIQPQNLWLQDMTEGQILQIFREQVLGK
ncbi:(2Fe-2S) ferredoxin domain-containing protein [Rufibacter latericius]|uniref:(2Fe-2S) ferredoxin domain-containing protein n=1 Tax=Rufibacter latericius TaxID=2487040 RepID=A0A3M9MTL6_9BACT|nr:(2Fe-2S) ferredoxin domain-containing protein [Rufibacter latericius]RNI28860.1 (2Fe-2S) ferredoxin domain-containing protein [Rufibacter latericius]